MAKSTVPRPTADLGSIENTLEHIGSAVDVLQQIKAELLEGKPDHLDRLEEILLEWLGDAVAEVTDDVKALSAARTPKAVA